MNLVEHYIIEVVSEKQYKGKFVIATVKTNCYGCIKENKHMATKEQWEREKIQGYFLG